MDDGQQIIQVSEQIAEAISRRDVDALARHLAPRFTHRTPGGGLLERNAFLEGIAGIPGDIAFVRLEDLHVEIDGRAAVVSGIQHARVVLDGQAVDDRRIFVDFFVKADDRWQIRAAVDGPPAADANPSARSESA